MTTHRTWLWEGVNAWEEIIMLLVWDGEHVVGITFGGYVTSDVHAREQLHFAMDVNWPGWWTEVL